jgi:hypothetical protein
MSRTDAILKELLRKIAAQEGHKDLKEAAHSLIYHEWEEITSRREFYTELGNLLRQTPLDFQAIQRSIQSKGSVILGGHPALRSQVNDFLKEQGQAETLIRDLIGDGSKKPDAGKVTSFIDNAALWAFRDKKGSPRLSEAALFTSVVLTCVFPDDFVDFRRDRWLGLAENFELEAFPWDAVYGERLFWAARIAKQLARTPTFRRYFATDRTNWMVAGLVWLFYKHDDYKIVIQQVRSGLLAQSEAISVLPSPTATKVSTLLRTKPQVVLQGAPGTGKTYTARLVAAQVLNVLQTDDEAVREALRSYQLAHILDREPALADDPQRLAEHVRASGHGLWDIVQLHPSYTYEDFVRGLRAEPSGERVTFRAVNRIFGLLAETAAALTDDDLPVVLILDEINRGDLSKVLGELIYALEYRQDSVLTPYAVDGRLDLGLPPNLYLIGTMNTADRSIALVDYAIRRRFYFVTMRADPNVINDYYQDRALGQRAVALFEAVEQLFQGLQAGYSAHDLMVGHTYFLARDAESLALKFAYDVVPLLREYQREGLLDRLTLRLDGQAVNLAKEGQAQLLAQIRDWLETTEVAQ